MVRLSIRMRGERVRVPCVRAWLRPVLHFSLLLSGNGVACRLPEGLPRRSAAGVYVHALWCRERGRVREGTRDWLSSVRKPDQRFFPPFWHVLAVTLPHRHLFLTLCLRIALAIGIPRGIRPDQ